MNIRKLCLSLLLTIVTFASMIALSGCSSVDRDEVHVSNITELKEASGNNNIIILDSDIDAQYSTLSGICCYEFQGNGHTISNAIINTNSFFTSAAIITNVKFENIIVNAEKVENAAVVLALPETYQVKDDSFNLFGSKWDNVGYGTQVEDITIKNCTIIATERSDKGLNVGTIFGSSPSKSNYVYGSNIGHSIKNCKIDNVNILATGSDEMIDMYVGGLVGLGENLTVESSSVLNSNMEVNAGGLYNDPYVGGLIGYFGEGCKASNSYSSNNEISVKATWYQKNPLNYCLSTSEVRVGGFVATSAEDTEFNFCYSESNSITLQCTGLYSSGGFGGACSGTFTQCYSIQNKIEARGRHEKDEEDNNRNYGGFIAAISSGAITSCYSYENSMLDEFDNKNKVGSEERNFGGFVGGSLDSILTNCASGQTSMTITENNDAFCSYTQDSFITSCYCDSSFANDNKCELLSDEDFIDFNIFKDMLLLFDHKWINENGKPPRLNLD